MKLFNTSHQKDQITSGRKLTFDQLVQFFYKLILKQGGDNQTIRYWLGVIGRSVT